MRHISKTGCSLDLSLDAVSMRLLSEVCCSCCNSPSLLAELSSTVVAVVVVAVVVVAVVVEVTVCSSDSMSNFARMRGDNNQS